MAAGVIGVTGVSVQGPVGQESRNNHANVIILYQHMVDHSALVNELDTKSAI